MYLTYYFKKIVPVLILPCIFEKQHLESGQHHIAPQWLLVIF